MSEIFIRPETPDDYAAIAELLMTTFHESYGTGSEEAGVVEKLRNLVPYISLVAAVDGTLIGHIFISPVTLVDFPDVLACTLGPIAVERQWQRQGVGTRLMQEGLAASRRAEYQAMVLTGDCNYYSRFGFIPISETRLFSIFKTPHDMVLELEPGTLAQVSGLVDYPEPWHAFVEEPPCESP
ncbi:MAG: GNAT family N-acetyltransferase [Armatimonadota bacterium]